jgi:type 1 fimbria pilin
MKKNLLVVAAATALVNMPSAWAQNTATLNVTGFVTPAACSVKLSDAELRWEVNSEDLNENELSALAPKRMDLTFTCNAGARPLVFQVGDDKAGTAMAIPDRQAMDLFGLGTVGSSNTPVGAYEITQELTTTGDGSKAIALRSFGDAGEFGTAYAHILSHGGNRYAWNSNDIASPQSYRSLSTTLTITPHLNKLSELPLADGLELNGAAVITLVY